MTKHNARINAHEEARRGNEALAAAKHLFQGEFWNDSISRAYYAAYHWARAVLLTRGLEPKTHRGVVQLIGLHFVASGKLTEESASWLAHLETYRELSDYSSSASFDRGQAKAEIARAERFIAACRPLIKTR